MLGPCFYSQDLTPREPIIHIVKHPGEPVDQRDANAKIAHLLNFTYECKQVPYSLAENDADDPARLEFIATIVLKREPYWRRRL